MAFSKFYRRHFDIVSKYNVGLKKTSSARLSKPKLYGDLVYKFRKIIGINDFRYKKDWLWHRCFATDDMLGC